MLMTSHSQTLKIHKSSQNELRINISDASNLNFVLEERSVVNGTGWMPYFNHPLPFKEDIWPVENLNQSNPPRLAWKNELSAQFL